MVGRGRGRGWPLGPRSNRQRGVVKMGEFLGQSLKESLRLQKSNRSLREEPNRSMTITLESQSIPNQRTEGTPTTFCKLWIYVQAEDA